MKMIGISARSMIRFWRSRPLRSGSARSRTRQLGPSVRGRARKSSADANVSGCQPAEPISSSSDSRTETSSSTTNTTGVSLSRVTTNAPDSLPVSPGELTLHSRAGPTQRGPDRIQQGCLAERLGQAVYGPAREQLWTDGAVCMGGNEDDRYLLPPPCQFLLKVGARHPRHRDVEEQTARFANDVGRREERFRGCKRLGGKTELPQQVRQRLAHGLVVVDARHQR